LKKTKTFQGGGVNSIHARVIPEPAGGLRIEILRHAAPRGAAPDG